MAPPHREHVDEDVAEELEHEGRDTGAGAHAEACGGSGATTGEHTDGERQERRARGQARRGPRRSRTRKEARQSRALS